MNQGGRVSIYQNEKLQIYQITYQFIYLHTKKEIHKNIGQKLYSSEDKSGNKMLLQSYEEFKGRKSTTQICTSWVWCCSSSSIFKIYLQQILGLRRLGSDNGLGFKPRFAEYIRLTSQIQKYTCYVHKKTIRLHPFILSIFSSVLGICLPNTLAIFSLLGFQMTLSGALLCA